MPEAQTEPCPACGSLLDVTGAQIFAARTCPVCATPINVRRQFGSYELMSVVGSGGQGVVYRAADSKLNRLVALKLLKTEFTTDPAFARQFEHEAKLTASINHPNVVRVFSFGTDEGHVYLAMELVDKGTLDDLMEKLTRVPEARALQIGIEIAQGLRAGIEKGLIHRDVKPGNILFGEDGSAKIVDFGLAMFFEQAAQEKGEIWGTPYYLSPERLNKSSEDFRSDIYSLGASLFHAIAGRPPFEAEDASHVALKHLRTQAVSLQTYAPDVSNSTAYVINRTLAKDPSERQQSYDEFIEQLQFAREEALARARGGGGQQKARVVLDDQKSKEALSWVTLATLAVLLIGLIVGAVLIVKGLRGGKGESSTPAPTATASIENFGPGWPEAKAKLFASEFNSAERLFAALAEAHPAGSTERAWARVHSALAAQLDGRTADAIAALDKLDGGGTQAGIFFHDLARRLGGTVRVPADAARNFNMRNHEALGALFLARRNLDLGHVDDAGALVRQFTSLAPEPSLAWLADYRKLAKPMHDEFVKYSMAADAWANARNAREREGAFNALRKLPAQLPPKSKLQPRVKELIAEAEARTAPEIAARIAAERKANAELAARMKSNLAYKAKVTASSHDKDDAPAKAVDGDSKTRWAARAAGEKWLAVDLGAPRQISRWVVRTSETGNDRPENITEARLQRSDDGATWSDVDKFSGNKSGVIDRPKPGDTTFRVYEFELGAAEKPK
jgi:eukaryotic-like serine/threonine-protein kinase